MLVLFTIILHYFLSKPLNEAPQALESVCVEIKGVLDFSENDYQIGTYTSGDRHAYQQREIQIPVKMGTHTSEYRYIPVKMRTYTSDDRYSKVKLLEGMKEITFVWFIDLSLKPVRLLLNVEIEI